MSLKRKIRFGIPLILACLACFNTSARNFVPILVNNITVMVPQKKFWAVQQSPELYQLRWLRQSGATSYKVERQTVDDSATITSEQLPTKWVPIAELTDTRLMQHHDLTSLELAGQQNYRLLTCVNSECSEVAQLSYQLDKAQLQNAIPQNFSIVPSTAGRMANNRSERRTDETSLFGKTSEVNAVSLPSTTGNATNQKRTFTLSWSPVAKATHYIVSRTQDRGDNPTYTSLLRREGTVHDFTVGAGTYDFVVYACAGFGYCGNASAVRSETVSVEVDKSRQPTNIQYPKQVDAGQLILMTWAPPADRHKLLGYRIWGENRGKIAEVAVYEPLYLTRNLPGEFQLAPGREYCYMIRAVYEAANGSSEMGDPVRSLCVTVGEEVVLASPDYLTILENSRLSTGIVLSWAEVPGADYYQLEREYPLGSGNWSPVYAGSKTSTVQYLSLAANETASTESYRVSACLADGRCGNYQRLYFPVLQSNVRNWPLNLLAPPSCLRVPTTVTAGQEIQIEWCGAQHPEVVSYVLTNVQGTMVASGTPENLPKTLQGLFMSRQPTQPAGSQYCYQVGAYINGINQPYYTVRQCGNVILATPTLIRKSEPRVLDYTIEWQPVAEANHYIVEERINSANWLEIHNSSLTGMAFSKPIIGNYDYRIKACISGNICSNWSAPFAAMRLKNTYISNDILGSPILRTNEDGSIDKARYYYPYGRQEDKQSQQEIDQ